MDAENTLFTRRAWRVLDRDESGHIDGNEFVVATWHFATLDWDQLAAFAFDLYALENATTLGADEVKTIVREVYGDKRKTVQLLAHVDRELRHRVSLLGFREFCASHPGILYPAVELQTTIRRSVGGVSVARPWLLSSLGTAAAAASITWATMYRVCCCAARCAPILCRRPRSLGVMPRFAPPATCAPVSPNSGGD